MKAFTSADLINLSIESSAVNTARGSIETWRLDTPSAYSSITYTT